MIKIALFRPDEHRIDPAEAKAPSTRKQSIASGAPPVVAHRQIPATNMPCSTLQRNGEEKYIPVIFESAKGIAA